MVSSTEQILALYVEVKALENSVSKAEGNIKRIYNETNWKAIDETLTTNAATDVTKQVHRDILEEEIIHEVSQLIAEIPSIRNTVLKLSTKLQTYFIQPNRENSSICSSSNSPKSQQSPKLQLKNNRKHSNDLEAKTTNALSLQINISQNSKNQPSSPDKQKSKHDKNTLTVPLYSRTVELKLNRLSLEDIQKWIPSYSQSCNNNLKLIATTPTNSTSVESKEPEEEQISSVRTRPKRACSTFKKKDPLFVTSVSDSDDDANNYEATAAFFNAGSDPEFRSDGTSDPESDFETENAGILKNSVPSVSSNTNSTLKNVLDVRDASVDPENEKKPPNLKTEDVNVEAHLKNIPKHEGYHCPYCRSPYIYSANRSIYLSNHIKKEHPNKKLTLELLRNSFTPYRCRICEAKLASIQSLKFHLQSHSIKRDYLCSVCGSNFKTIKRMHQHINHMHVNRYHQACPFCPKRFHGREQLIRHVKDTHPDKPSRYHGLHPNKCKICGKEYRQYSGYMSHMTKEHNPKAKKPTCKICGKVLSQPQALKRHMKSKHEENPTVPVAPKERIKCYFCPSSYITISAINYHLRVQHFKEEQHKKKSSQKKQKEIEIQTELNNNNSDKESDEIIVKDEDDISDHEVGNDNHKENQLDIGKPTESQSNQSKSNLTPVDDAPASWFQ